MNRLATSVGVFVLALSSRSAFAQAVTERVSVASSGAQEDDSSGADWVDGRKGIALSADGARVAFASKASNLVSSDANGQWDVFVRDRVAGTTERVSVDSAGVEGDAESSFPVISADGRFVAFMSKATNLVAGDSNADWDVFAHDLATGVTERVSVDSAGAEVDGGGDSPSISADGRFVVFTSSATSLVAGDTNGASDIFVHDRSTGATERISVDSSGTEANGASSACSISGDGNRVAFLSYATNLVAGDANGVEDVFVHDLTTGVTERVNVDSSGAEADDITFETPSLSADGSLVAFSSRATNLVQGDTNGDYDVFVRDRGLGMTERASVDSAGGEANDGCFLPAISSDGRRVVFESRASNLVTGDKNLRTDVFVHDRSDGLTECASVDPNGIPANWDSLEATTSEDGQVIAFASDANNVVPGDTSGWDVFARELCVTPATWTNYGVGFPGLLGVPSFTVKSFPVIGSNVALDVGNSSGALAPGVLFVGFQRASLHTSLGGDLLLLPSVGAVIVLAPSGTTIAGAIPRDETLCGTVLDLQVLEVDAGAVKGVSFTPGLELVIGN